MSSSAKQVINRPKGKHYSIERQDNIAGFLFALPWMFGFLVFTVYALAMSGYYSFTQFNAVKDPVWIGLENYRNVFADPKFIISLKNTLWYTFVHAAVALSLSLLLAILVKTPFRGQSATRVIFFMPSVIPLVASTMIWLFMLEASNGLVNQLLRAVGINAPNWFMNPAYTKPALILMECWMTGTTMMILLAALKDVPESYYEAASLDGANALRKFWHITLPSISHVLYYQLILAIINGFQYFTRVNIILTATAGGNVYVSGGPSNSLLMYPLYLYQNAFAYMNMGKASAMAWILFVIVAALTAVMLLISKRAVSYGQGGE